MTEAAIRYKKLIEELFEGKLRVTKIAAAKKLNVSVKTIDRYLIEEKLLWAGNQVSVVSIIDYLSSGPQTEEPAEEVDAKLQQAHAADRAARKPLAQPSRHGRGWVKGW